MSSDEDSEGAVLFRKKKKVRNSASRRNTVPVKRSNLPSQQAQTRRSTHTGSCTSTHHSVDPPTTAEDDVDVDDDLMSSIRKHNRNNHHHHHDHPPKRRTSSIQNDKDDGIRIRSSNANNNYDDDGIRIRASSSLNHHHSSDYRRRSTGSDYNDGIRVSSSSTAHSGVAVRQGESLNSVNRRRSTGDSNGYHHHHHHHHKEDTNDVVGQHVNNNGTANRRHSNVSTHNNHHSDYNNTRHRSALKTKSNHHEGDDRNIRSEHVQFKQQPQNPMNNTNRRRSDFNNNNNNLDDGIRVMSDSAKRLSVDASDNERYHETSHRNRPNHTTSGQIRRPSQDHTGVANRNNNTLQRNHHHTSITQTIDENSLLDDDDLIADYTKFTKSPEVARRVRNDDDVEIQMTTDNYDDSHTEAAESTAKSSEVRRFKGLFRSSDKQKIKEAANEVMRKSQKPDPCEVRKVTPTNTAHGMKKKSGGKKSGGKSVVSFFKRRNTVSITTNIADEFSTGSSDESDNSNNEGNNDGRKKSSDSSRLSRRQSSGKKEYEHSSNDKSDKNRRGSMKESSNNSYHSFLSGGRNKEKKIKNDNNNSNNKRPKTPEQKLIKPEHPQGLYEPWIHRIGSLHILQRPNERFIVSSDISSYQTKGIKFKDNDKYVPQPKKRPNRMSRYGFIVTDESKESSTTTATATDTCGVVQEEKCMESTLYPTVFMASMQMDAMRHRHLVQLARIKNRKKKDGHTNSNKDDLALPTHRYFPKDCLQVLRLLEGNDRCIDCGNGGNVDYLRLRRDSKHVMEAEEIEDVGRTTNPGHGTNNDALVWASLAHGTMLCNQCAFRHITKNEEKQFKDTGNVKSLIEGEWSLIDVITMLEGGNHKLLNYVDGKISSKRTSNSRDEIPSLLGRTEVVKMSKGADTAFNAAYDSIYKSKRVAAYRKTLSLRVDKISALHGCDGSKPIRKPHHYNMTNLPTNLYMTSSPVSSNHQPENSKTFNNSHDDNTPDNLDLDVDGIRVFSDNHRNDEIIQ